MQGNGPAWENDKKGEATARSVELEWWMFVAVASPLQEKMRVRLEGLMMRTFQTKPYVINNDEGRFLQSLGARVSVKASWGQTGGPQATQPQQRSRSTTAFIRFDGGMRTSAIAS